MLRLREREHKPGGIIKTDKLICCPFLIAPYRGRMAFKLPDGFACRPLDMECDEAETGRLITASCTGGVCRQINGASDETTAAADPKEVLALHAGANLSKAIVDKANGRIAALCVAGVGKDDVNGYAEIAGICILPVYRKRGSQRICRDRPRPMHTAPRPVSSFSCTLATTRNPYTAGRVSCRARGSQRWP